MNRNMLIGFAVVLAVVLALPLLAGLMNPPAPSPAKPAAAAPAAAAQPATPQPAAPPQAPPAQQPVYAPPPQQAAPFQFDANTLTGTGWQVNTPHGTVQIYLEPGGQLRATHPMVGQITGNWRVAGNQVTATVSAFGQSQTIACQIQGDQLVYQGRPVQRVR